MVVSPLPGTAPFVEALSGDEHDVYPVNGQAGGDGEKFRHKPLKYCGRLMTKRNCLTTKAEQLPASPGSIRGREGDAVKNLLQN